MKFFFVALAETKHLEDIFAKIAEWDERLRKLRGIRVGVMIRFTKWKRACTPCRLAERYNLPLFVDNGAFSYLSTSELEEEHIDSSVLRRWVVDYAGWMRTWHNYVTAAALPDVPVHGRDFLPPLLRGHRIWLTAQLHVMYARLARETLPRMVVVLQGFTVEEYAKSLKLHLENYNLLGETLSFNPNKEPYGGIFGVGSVCVRKLSAKGSTALLAGGKAAGTLKEFMKDFLAYEWPELVRGFHFFGLHTEAVRWFHSHPRYYASDTGAHGLAYKYKWRTVLGCRRLGRECAVKAVEAQLKTTLGVLANPMLHSVGAGTPTLKP